MANRQAEYSPLNQLGDNGHALMRFGASKTEDEQEPALRGFDSFELRLGDIMRGERATMGKSLLDVQRELRIKAAYISAIENCDPDAFDTPGFIAGYVRSYARYLNMDPDDTFAVFCEESGFQVAHGMAAEASVVRKSTREDRLNRASGPPDIFASPKTPFVPAGDAVFSRIEPGAVGSLLVLVGLIVAIGYGGWTVLQEVQRVQVVPVDQTPVVQSDIDPLFAATRSDTARTVDDTPRAAEPNTFQTAMSMASENNNSAIVRLYRPQALEEPILIPRDGAIATLDPREIGVLAGRIQTPEAPEILIEEQPQLPAEVQIANIIPRVVEDLGPTVRMVAAYPSWVRVRSVEGATLFEGTLAAGETWDVPEMEVAPVIRIGESGAIYFAMGSDCFGPVGDRGVVTSGFSLDRSALADNLQPVDPFNGTDPLNVLMASLGGADTNSDSLSEGLLAKLPCQPN